MIAGKLSNISASAPALFTRSALMVALLTASFFFAETPTARAQEPAALSAAQMDLLNKQLFSAVRSNNLAQVRSRINGGADPEAVNEDGLTPAGLAIEKGYFDVAHYLLGVRNLQLKSRDKTDPDKAVAISPPPLPTPAASPPRAEPTLQTDTLPPAPRLNLPSGQADPFDPNSKTGGLPVMGPVQAPSVKPVVPSQPLQSNINKLPTQPSRSATSGTQNHPGPTPIKPLEKRPEPVFTPTKTTRTITRPKSKREEKGVLDKMMDGVTDVFKSDDETPDLKLQAAPPKPAPAKPATAAKAKNQKDAGNKSQEKGEETGFIGGVWKKITDIF